MYPSHQTANLSHFLEVKTIETDMILRPTNFSLMKTLIIVASFLVASSASACGSMVSSQSFPSVPLSSFGINSWAVAKTAPVTAYKYDFSSCVAKQQASIGASVPTQHFASVPLSQFNYNSWMIAK